MSFEEQLVRSCSPTLAGLKTGNLFRYRCRRETRREVGGWRRRLSEKGIQIRVMRFDDDYVLVYVYRVEMLERDLGDPGISAFLRDSGYDTDDAEGCVEMLRKRMVSEDFPHEVGLFLGYPLNDVLGFINNCGRDCRFCGCWKVYDNEHQTREQFVRFKECSRTFMERYSSGIGVIELTV